MPPNIGYGPKQPMRPRPQVPGTINPRFSVLKDLKKPERKRYSTNLSEAAARAAVEKL